MTDAERRADAISVSAALSIAKGALEGITVRILGEISEVSNKPGYKAVYFTVKDDRASLPCMMWMNRYASCGVELKVGSLVEISGRFSLYAAKGRMNFDVFSVALAGEGNLRLKVANLAKELQAKGLMDPSRKRSITPLPERIGLVTSPRGAAVHDVLRTLRRRYPLAKVYLAGVPVEGADAPKHLIAGIEALSKLPLDVILLVRGGGSFEDLMPFNDEQLAYAIASCPIPVVTGIGHEPDTSIADMVADMRASTPTAAAEGISPALSEISHTLGGYARRIEVAESRAISDLHKRLKLIEGSGMFKEPLRLFANEAQTIDDMASRLSRALPVNLEKCKVKLSFLKTSFARLVGSTIVRDVGKIQVLSADLRRLGKKMFDPFKARITMNASRLEDLSPLKVLDRGYAIARTGDGAVVSTVDAVSIGESLEVVVSNGAIDCDVRGVRRLDISVEEHG